MAVGALIGTNPYPKSKKARGGKRRKTVSKKKKGSSRKGSQHRGRNPFNMATAKKEGGSLVTAAAVTLVVEGLNQYFVPAHYRTGYMGAGLRVVEGIVLEQVAKRIPIGFVKAHGEDIKKTQTMAAAILLVHEKALPHLPKKDLTTVDAIQTQQLAAEAVTLASQPGTPAAQAIQAQQAARAALVTTGSSTVATAAAAQPSGGAAAAGAGEVFTRSLQGTRDYTRLNEREINLNKTSLQGANYAAGGQRMTGAASGVGPWGANKFDYRRN